MTEQHSPGGTDGPETRHARKRSGSWWPVFVPSIALLVGLLLGGVVVGVANNHDGPSAHKQATSLPSAGSGLETQTAGPTTIVVPAECLAVADTVDQLTELTRKGAGAIRDFQPQQLRDLLTRLEELDKRARRQAQACRAVEVNKSSE